MVVRRHRATGGFPGGRGHPVFKRDADHADSRDLDSRVTRIVITYGPRMRTDDGRVIPTFVRQALTGEDLTVYGDGTQTRSFCSISDLIDGLQALLKADVQRSVTIGWGSSRYRDGTTSLSKTVDCVGSSVVHR
ncbi:MAG: NAD-dependent epimerase/dehydratase family protein [Haloarculaceae archaeon]